MTDRVGPAVDIELMWDYLLQGGLVAYYWRQTKRDLPTMARPFWYYVAMFLDPWGSGFELYGFFISTNPSPSIPVISFSTCLKSQILKIMHVLSC